MFCDLFDFKSKDIVTVVGCGGKTSFIKKTIKEVNYEKILITTSTKVLKKEFDEYDFEIFGEKVYNEKFLTNGKYLIYDYEINNLKKLVGYDKKIIDNIVDKFDFSIIEGDGSRGKKLKGWIENEPVVINKSTKTIGIINLKLLGKTANEDIIHNLDEFLSSSKLKKNDTIKFNNIANIVCHNQGLFKNSVGKKILYINQLDSEEEFFLGVEFSKKILDKIDAKVVLGSLKNNKYKVIRG